MIITPPSPYEHLQPQAAPVLSSRSSARLRGAAITTLVSDVADGDNGNAAGAVIDSLRQRKQQAAMAKQVQASKASAQQATVDQQQTGQSSLNKSDAACLEGKGYSIK